MLLKNPRTQCLLPLETLLVEPLQGLDVAPGATVPWNLCLICDARVDKERRAIIGISPTS